MPTGEHLGLDARIVLTVGSDCAIGKMTVSLELDREARRRGIASLFVPTGQTGIAIAGWGISVDAVVSDFVDLDGNLLLLEDPWPGVELRDGVQLPPLAPGLGVAPAAVPVAERRDGAR